MDEQRYRVKSDGTIEPIPWYEGCGPVFALLAIIAFPIVAAPFVLMGIGWVALWELITEDLPLGITTAVLIIWAIWSAIRKHQKNIKDRCSGRPFEYAVFLTLRCWLRVAIVCGLLCVVMAIFNYPERMGYDEDFYGYFAFMFSCPLLPVVVMTWKNYRKKGRNNNITAESGRVCPRCGGLMKNGICPYCGGK